MLLKKGMQRLKWGAKSRKGEKAEIGILLYTKDFPRKEIRFFPSIRSLQGAGRRSRKS